ncbi:hypothetical protein [Aquimarina sp. 2304DJ70-9]|uniref:hypothetical protein n=1 Tax=Aquimarina penaris TaxID=3231044 RepID=UPI003462F703
MKTKYFKHMLYIVLASTLVVTSCSKDDDPLPIPTEIEINDDLDVADGIGKDDLATNKGEIGIIINARNVAKKGVLPVTAEVKIDATEGDYSRTLDINKFTNMASISFLIDELSDAAIAELKEGISILVDIKDEAGKIILTESFSKVSFKENGTPVNITANALTVEEKPLSFNPEIPYYFQLILDNELSDLTITTAIAPNISLYAPRYRQNSFNSTENIKSQYYLAPVPGKNSTFYIREVGTNFYWSAVPLNNLVYFQYEELTDISLANQAHEFIIETNASGSVSIKHEGSGHIYRAKDTGAIPNHVALIGLENEYYDIAEFRIIPATIQWEVSDFGTTEFMKPILPAAETSFGFNSTLVNCSQGTLEQEVGGEISEETSTTVGWEESIELSSESTYEVSTSVEASVSASYFGFGAEVSASTSSSHSVSRGMTASNAGFGDRSTSKTQTFFSSRTIEVLPKTAVLVYDAYQTYSNVMVSFVKRFRVRGKDIRTNTDLTGNEIESQFSFNNFNGVITEVGSDFVEVTVRGTMKLDNLIETQSQVSEVESTCN